jgi:hypothetical protein
MQSENSPFGRARESILSFAKQIAATQGISPAEAKKQLRRARKLVRSPARFYADYLAKRYPARVAPELLSPDQALRENGFYAVRGLLPQSVRTDLAAKLHAVAKNAADGQEWMSVDCVNRVDVVADMLFDGRIHKAVRAAIGPDIRFLQVSDVQFNHDHLNWHRDSSYRAPCAAGAFDWDESRDPYRVIKILIYLESENAGLAMLPGTHQAPPTMDAERVAKHEAAGEYTVVGPKDEANRHFSAEERSRPLMFCANPGDALIFDERLYHCGRRLVDGRVVRNVEGRKLTLSYVFGADNVHSRRIYSYFRFIRNDLSYRALPQKLARRIEQAGLALSSGWGNHFEGAPAAELEGLYRKEPPARGRSAQPSSRM